MEDNEKPFRAEYAKSDRSACKLCKNNIQKDSLRLAPMVQSPHFDGKVPLWHHFSCFFKKVKSLKDVDEISGFHHLRWDDQEQLRQKITGKSGGGTNSSASAKDHLTSSANDFSTEYAKSGRSTCRQCMEKIEKGAVRISKKAFDPTAPQYGNQDQWYHVDCMAKEKEKLEFCCDPESVPGFDDLSAEDQKEFKKKLSAPGKAPKGRKRKGAKAVEEPKKVKVENGDNKENEELKAMREQSELLWKLKDELRNGLTTEAMKQLLEHNDVGVPKGETAIVERLSDCMAFGVPVKCTQCKTGTLYARSDGYHCSGFLSAWTKCHEVTQNPVRQAFLVPAEMADECPFLKKYRYKARERVFPKKSETNGVTESSDPTQPLRGFRIATAGKLSRSAAKLKAEVVALGGTIALSVDASVLAVISNEAEVSKDGKKIRDARSHGVHVVSEDWLEAVRSEGKAMDLMEKHSLSKWGQDAAKRLTKSAGAAKVVAKNEKAYALDVSTIKLKVKGGAAVDPDSGLADTCSVMQHRGKPLSAVLGLVDIARGTNAYYRLQVLKEDKGGDVYVFRSWGRIGTTIGGNKLETMSDAEEAVERFEELFLEKTGNKWGSSDMQKRPGQYFLLEMDYGDEEEGSKAIDAGDCKCLLPSPVQKLIRMLFDEARMTDALKELDIDLKKMPLGKLKRSQMEQAFRLLSDLQDGLTSHARVLDLSTQFYTLIPHDLGMRKPPLIDSTEMIRSKTEMVQALLDLELTFRMLRSSDRGDGEHPLDAHFRRLNSAVDPVDAASAEWKMVERYMKNTHAKTHANYSLKVVEVYRVDRNGERAKFAAFSKLHNRMLLWHGSRVTNFAGILSQGLRIAPPEAPSTGYMFGKGVYFADMSSKSANYCYTSSSSPTGLMLLSEVALGEMYERLNADFITKLPAGKHSTKGCGRTAPDPKVAEVTPEGVVIPLGKPVDTGVHGSLLYNEYIVYDVAQINTKYLVEVKFVYK